MAIILVVGVGEDSGKTTVAASLASFLSGRGFKVSVSKPIGASELWLRPWVLRESESRGIVVTGDAVILARSLRRGDVNLEVLNPVAAILAPIDYSRFPPRSSSAEAASLLPALRVALLRISECTSSSVKRLHLSSKEALERAPESIAARLRDSMGSLKPRPLLVNSGFISSVLSSTGIEAADTCLSMLDSTSDLVVVESNSDVAAPTSLSVAKADAVIVAAPGVACVYSGERWRMAVQLQVSIGSPWRTTVSDIMEIARPEKLVAIPVTEDPLEEGIPEDAVEKIVEAALSVSPGLRRVYSH